MSVDNARMSVANSRMSVANTRMSVDNGRMSVDIALMSAAPHPCRRRLFLSARDVVGTLKEERALARVPGERRGALELLRGLGVPPQLGKEVTAHGGE